MRVTSTEMTVRVEMNGVTISEATRQQMKQTSPQHVGVSRTSGKMCLLPHTGRSEYRNFRLRKLSAGADSSPTLTSVEALQGNWVATREEGRWRSRPLHLREAAFVFTDRKLVMTRKYNGVPGKYEGTFDVDPASAAFRLHGQRSGRLNSVAWRGIYERDGDSLTLCYKYVKDAATIRPTRFKTDDDPGAIFVLVELRRVPASKAPPKDASEFQRHAYKFFPEDLTWHQAKNRCEEMGGHLPTVASAAENEFIANLAKKGIPQLGNHGAWLGATDEQKEGDWQWIDGKLMDFNVWGPGQPNNKDNAEHYLMLWLPESQWSDQPDESIQHATILRLRMGCCSLSSFATVLMSSQIVQSGRAFAEPP